MSLSPGTPNQLWGDSCEKTLVRGSGTRSGGLHTVERPGDHDGSASRNSNDDRTDHHDYGVVDDHLLACYHYDH